MPDTRWSGLSLSAISGTMWPSRPFSWRPLGESGEAGVLESRGTAAIGFWSSVILAGLAIVYLVTLALYFTAAGFVFPPSATVQTVAGVITFLTVPLMVVLFSAIREALGSRSLLGTISLSFILLFAAVVSIEPFHRAHRHPSSA